MEAGGRLSPRDMLIVQAKTIEYIDSMENFYIYKPRALILRVIMMYAGITYIFALLTFPITAAFMALFWGILIFKYTQAIKLLGKFNISRAKAYICLAFMIAFMFAAAHFTHRAILRLIPFIAEKVYTVVGG